MYSQYSRPLFSFYLVDQCRGGESGEQGWRSGDSARLPPICPGFDSRTKRHMWVELVVGSRPCSESFSPGSPVFLPSQKPTFLNCNSIGNSRATGLSVEHCCVSPSLNKVDLNVSLNVIKHTVNHLSQQPKETLRLNQITC